MTHRNAPLSPEGRRRLVQRCQHRQQRWGGQSQAGRVSLQRQMRMTLQQKQRLPSVMQMLTQVSPPLQLQRHQRCEQ